MSFDGDYTFEFTDHLNPVFKHGSRTPSEAISALYYDAASRTLVVVIAESGNAYLYEDVPVYVWSAFKNSLSKGFFYSRAIKNTYGPANNLGDADQIFFEDVRKVPASTGNVIAFPSTTSGTPKGLTYASDAKVTTSAPVFDLIQGGKDEDAVERLHEVVFTVEGVRDERSYRTETTDVETAVEALGEVADMLSLNFTVKRVIVHFE